LNEIEKQTNRCDKLEDTISNWHSAEGFYIKLQENINEWTDWGRVPKGGFIGFWYHWIVIEKIGELYIQIENAFEYGIKLVIKIAGWEQKIDILYKIYNEIKLIAEKNGLSITKPERYRVGETSTVAIIQNAFQSENNNNFDFNDFLMTLKKLEKTLDEYKSQYNN